ncbi:hypothetical protein OBA40_08715 [Alphaproteobacteria bacterium]|nr:hypothetical protein [Alphaproteobacteria bacterium]
MTYQKCIKCLKIMPATTEYFYKSKTHKLGIHKSCKSCDYIRHKFNLNVRKKNNSFAFQMSGNLERRWLVCSRRVLRDLNKQNWSSNENKWNTVITNLTNNLRKPNRLREMSSNIQSNKNETTNLSIKWNYIIRKKVLGVLRNTLINSINSTWEKEIQRIYISTLIHTRGRLNGK